MTFKNLLSVAVVAALMTGSAAVAQDPTIAIDLVRNGDGLPVLSADGNFQFVVTATPGAIVDADMEGDGDSLALALGIEVSTGSLISGSTQTGIEQQDGMLTNDTMNFDGNPDTFDTLIPAPIFFGFADPATNGSVTGAGTGGAFPLGIVEGNTGTVDAINVGIGSDELNAGTFNALFFDVDGPSTAGAGNLTVGVDITSALAAQAVDPASPGDPSSLVFDLLGGSSTLSFSATVLAGDANLDGVINVDDLAVFGGGAFGSSTTAGFAAGDFDRSGTIDVDDLANFGGGAFGTSGPAPAVLPSSVVPEPTAALLLIAALATSGLTTRRRS